MGFNSYSIPISQISSVNTTGLMGKMSIETTGGKSYSLSLQSKHQNELRDTITKQQNKMGSDGNPSARSESDEIAKLASLRDSGILTEEEFQAKKRQLLGL
jgi:hypothetical protein